MDQRMIDTVSRMGVHVRLLERALHGSERWTLRWRGQESFLDRAVEDDSLVFSAEFDATDNEGDGYAFITIEGEEIMAVTAPTTSLDSTIIFRLRPFLRHLQET